MNFARLSVGDRVFVDANPFVYHFVSGTKYSAACTTLLERIERQELSAWTSSNVLAEVTHRLMTIEACATWGWPQTSVAARLRAHPTEICRLTQYQRAMAQLDLISLQVLAVDAAHVADAVQISAHDGLLTNDAIIVALMRRQGLTGLASNDADFDRVAGIVRYAPE